MKNCPECSGALMKSTLKDVYGCSVCKNLFTISRVVFQAPPEPEKAKPITPPMRDLTTMPEPVGGAEREVDDE